MFVSRLRALTVGATGDSQTAGDSAFARLHAAYLARDAEAAAAAYANDAEVVYRGSGAADERYVGRASDSLIAAPGDEELEADYCDALVGRYHRADGCDEIVTRSIVRLHVRNGCTQEWRGLTRVSGRERTCRR